MNLDFDYYSGTDLIYPQKPSKPSLSRNPSAAVWRDYADDLEVYEKQLESYKSDLAWYYEQQNIRRLELQTKLRDEYGITEAQMFVLWNKAYELGHSEGLNRVVAVFDELHEVASEFAALEKG
jgi:phage terminase large subunit-like protein